MEPRYEKLDFDIKIKYYVECWLSDKREAYDGRVKYKVRMIKHSNTYTDDSIKKVRKRKYWVKLIKWSNTYADDITKLVCKCNY